MSVTAIIRNTRVANLRPMPAKYQGICDQTGQKFDVGTPILFKGKTNLTPDEIAGLFTSRGKPAYTVVAIASACELVSDGGQSARDEYQEYRTAQKKGIVYETQTAHKPKFPPSVYQKNILDTVLTKAGHVLIRALAGSGKTTTLVWLLFELLERGLLDGKNVIYLAFNVNIKNELLHKLQGTNIPAKTTHGFCMGELLSIPSHVRVMKGNSKSQLFFLKAVCDRLQLAHDDHGRKIAKKSAYWEIRKQVYELVGYIKNWAVLPAYSPDGGWQFTVNQVQEIESFINRYKIAIPVDRREEAVDWACTVISLGTPNPGDEIQFLDFDDMLFLPLSLNVPIPKYDLVLSDESQDFNKAQLLILEKLAKAGARIISVGDENQGIYRFRGAAGKAMDWLGEMFLGTSRGVDTCDLPINYRSDQAIIEWANQWVPDLLGSKTERGEVNFDLSFAQAMDEAKNDPYHSYAFLCRTNLPLVVTAYQLIAKKKRIHILGKDGFAGPILGLIGELCRTEGDSCNRISDRKNDKGEVIESGLLTRLSEHMKTQWIKLAGEQFKTQLEFLENYAECIEIIATNVLGDTVSGVYEEINNLFADSPEPGVINLATIHGAKGLEWDTVYIVRPDLLPHPMVKMYNNEDDEEVSEEYQEELNACYVAATRAKHRLRYILNWPFGKGMGPVKFLPTQAMKLGTNQSRSWGQEELHDRLREKNPVSILPHPSQQGKVKFQPVLEKNELPMDEELDNLMPFI